MGPSVEDSCDGRSVGLLVGLLFQGAKFHGVGPEVGLSVADSLEVGLPVVDSGNRVYPAVGCKVGIPRVLHQVVGLSVAL